jgi:glycosyltransferase involved in cell wall biosynthesis
MLLVLGVHRSGTSTIARSLECIGAVPSARLHEPMAGNPKGFFEDLDVQRFNQYTLLPALSLRWHDLAQPDWTRLSDHRRAELVGVASEIIARNFPNDAAVCVLKDPRLCVLLPFWQQVLHRSGFDMKAVCAVRDPLSVARSLQARDGIPIRHGAALYAAQWAYAHASSKHLPRTFMSYDALLADPRGELTRVAAGLALTCPPDFPDRVASMSADFLDVSLRHSISSPEECSRNPEVPEIAVRVHGALTALRAGSTHEPAAAEAVVELEAISGTLVQAGPVLAVYDHAQPDAETPDKQGHPMRSELDSILQMTDRRAVDALRVNQLERQMQSLHAEVMRLNADAQAAARGDRRNGSGNGSSPLRPNALRRLAQTVSGLLLPVWQSLQSPARRQKHALRREVKIVRASGLFDAAYYVEQNPDVRGIGLDPVDHYVRYGWREGRNPSATFDTRFYLGRHVPGRDRNPLIHYHQVGRYAGCATREASQGDLAGIGLEAPALADCAADRWSARVIVKIRRALGLTPTAPAPPSKHRSSGDSGRPERSMADRQIPRSCTVLFIGCDGLVAGSQVLLLNAIQWLRRHTGIEARIILIRGGDLSGAYAECGPMVVWQDLLARLPDRSRRREELLRLYADIDLIYGNTVIAPELYVELECLGKPVLTHVHELEKSIRAYASASAIEAMVRLSSRFVACSRPVAANLIENHGIDPGRIATINDFIEHREYPVPARAALRGVLGLPQHGLLVVGCGTIYGRKGTDLFVDTAIRCRELGIGDATFIWVGGQHWDTDAESAPLGPWRDIMGRISGRGMSDSIRFVGARSNAREYMAAADLFLLPSREDPFPLVCLEAAQCGTPIVCFDGAGGMPEFVSSDAGVVVPYLDTAAAAQAIKRLHDDRGLLKRLGDAASAKLRARHTDEIAVPLIAEQIHQAAGTAPLVSVIVPVFNQRPFLERRIESILAQDFRDIEIIILDDCSTDGSLELARSLAARGNIRVVESDRNSGSPFGQWARGIHFARGTYVWIAEGDDSSEPAFLSEVLPMLGDPSVSLAYSDSVVIDAQDRPIDDYRQYYESLDRSHWRMDHVVPVETEINLGLGVKNTIPNVSAVVFRRDRVTPDLLSRIATMRFAGDWMFYVQLAKGGKIAFRRSPLNLHRRHATTVTRQFHEAEDRKRTLLAEVGMVHEWVVDQYSLSQPFRERMLSYLAAQVEALFPAAEGNRLVSPDRELLERVDSRVAQSARRRIAVTFVTTNDWSHDGGSEQLWIHAAQRMAGQGHRVQVVIRRWDPEPYFIAAFRAHGIEVVFKDTAPEGAVESFRPDLVVISIGDQDEGTEWYEACTRHRLPFVIVNHLTKEPKYWPIRHELQDSVRLGNLAARRVLFTSINNRVLMERRLRCTIPQAGLFHNPLFLDRSRRIPFPPSIEPLRLAMPARMLNIHKGLDVAVEVFALDKWQSRPIELHLYGHGPDEEALRATVKKSGQRNVFFHDPQWQLPHPDMEAIWRECHGLLMTSFMEGMPLVLLNAMFYGRVPIVTDIGGHREVVEDGVNGFVAEVPARDSVDSALERAWRRRAEWERIGIAARERMLRFAPEDPVADLIEKLLLATAESHRA